jgi:hypothetical protein
MNEAERRLNLSTTNQQLGKRVLEHWERLAACQSVEQVGEEGINSGACAFCHKYYNNGSCVGCPVYRDTGQTDCEGTPFVDIWPEFYGVKTGQTEFSSLHDAILVELDYLKGVIGRLED